MKSLIARHSKQQDKAVEVYNVGISTGNSVMDTIPVFEKFTDQKFPCAIGSRRPGNVIQTCTKIQKIEADLILEEALQNA